MCSAWPRTRGIEFQRFEFCNSCLESARPRLDVCSTAWARAWSFVLRFVASVRAHHAKQVFASALGGHGIAFEVDEQIAWRRFGKSTQSLVRDDIEQLDHRHRTAARFDLYPRLISHSISLRAWKPAA